MIKITTKMAYITFLQSQLLTEVSQNILQIDYGDEAVALSVKHTERVTNFILNILVMIVL